MLVGLLTALLVFVSIVLIVLIVALQHGNEGGIGSAFGGGNSAGFFGASGGVALIVRATWIFGASFFVLSTALAWVKTYDKFGVTRELESVISEGVEAPAETPKIAPATEAQPPVQPAQAEPGAQTSEGTGVPESGQNSSDPAPGQPAQ
jgi:preprotein translocase subunit SecG